ncbi:hypothetical protein RZS08_40025, partial [Arthrospira platensis SPKY1]|nr:hypothetical protein [Arthrospira platensis SPKY1]
LALAIHPANENFLLLGMTNVYRIRNIGTTTQFSTTAQKEDVLIGGYGVTTFFRSNMHPDQHLFVFPDPENRPDYLIAANDGGLYSTLDIQRQGSPQWQDLNIGYNVTQFYHASISPRT